MAQKAYGQNTLLALPEVRGSLLAIPMQAFTRKKKEGLIKIYVYPKDFRAVTMQENGKILY